MRRVNNRFSLLEIVCFLIALIFSSTTVYGFRNEDDYLNGKHLIVSGLNSLAGLNMVRNSTGHIIKFNGLAVHMLQWLSQRYNFTYSIFQINETALDTFGTQIGLIDHLLNNNCQLLFSVAATKSRVPLLDFTQPNLYVPVSYLIMKPDISANFASIVYSFEAVVWIAVFASMLCVSTSLYFFRRYVDISYSFEKIRNPMKKPWQDVSSYVLGVILTQGGHLPLKSMPFYLIGGVWCLGAFILVNAYTSTLISHVALPNQKPLINSIYDLRNRSEIHLVTDRNLNTDAVLTSAESGFLKYLGDQLRSYPESRCKSTKRCIELVKTGTHVYSSGVSSFLIGAMRDDFRATGKCNLLLQLDSYMNLPISLALPKHSKITMIINQGILEMREKGLLDEWASKSQPNARQCLAKDNKHKFKSLSLKDVSGIFVVLSFGLLVSFLTFIGERILFCKSRATSSDQS